MDQKSWITELAVEFANNIISSADHEKSVLGEVGVEIPDKEMFYIYLVLWESWMFFVALGAVNPKHGEEIFNKTLIQAGSILRKISLERFMTMSTQLFPSLTSNLYHPQNQRLSDTLSHLFFGRENAVEGFDDYVNQVTSSTIQFHQKTIQEVLG